MRINWRCNRVIPWMKRGVPGVWWVGGGVGGWGGRGGGVEGVGGGGEGGGGGGWGVGCGVSIGCWGGGRGVGRESRWRGGGEVWGWLGSEGWAGEGLEGGRAG